MTPETKAFIEEVKSRQQIRSCTCGFQYLDKIFDIIESQEKEIERLRTALEFYANDYIYEPVFESLDDEGNLTEINDFEKDRGIKAKLALEMSNPMPERLTSEQEFERRK